MEPMTKQQSSQVNCIPALLCATPGKWEGKKTPVKYFLLMETLGLGEM